ncbi:MAG: 50S ribosomal protein L23 [Nanoarchaeota archaeon]|nr:50S ribosomal protein L23 [Nanoarchaeota archaeon]
MILLYPLTTEKSVKLVESENKVVFIVDNKATKVSVKREFEKLLKTKVEKVNISNGPKGRKKAYIKLSKEANALDVATELGIM